MTSLKFNGDITLEEVFNLHRITIYDKVVESICANYRDPAIHEITVINITINAVDYTVNLSRDKFISGLENAISFYEKSEAYEKCQLCLNVINELKNNAEVVIK